MFISFHPRSSIQYNVCYNERKYCKCCRSVRTQDVLICAVLYHLLALPATHGCNFYTNFFTTFGRKNQSLCHQHKGTPHHFYQILRQLIQLEM